MILDDFAVSVPEEHDSRFDHNGNYHPMADFVAAFLPLLLAKNRQLGIEPSEWDFERARARWKEMSDAETGMEGGAELLFYSKGKSGKAMAILLDVLSVMAYIPGGIEFCGKRYFGRESDRAEWENLRKKYPVGEVQS
jgi:hypothetical protein